MVYKQLYKAKGSGYQQCPGCGLAELKVWNTDVFRQEWAVVSSWLVRKEFIATGGICCPSVRTYIVTFVLLYYTYRTTYLLR